MHQNPRNKIEVLILLKESNKWNTFVNFSSVQCIENILASVIILASLDKSLGSK